MVTWCRCNIVLHMFKQTIVCVLVCDWRFIVVQIFPLSQVKQCSGPHEMNTNFSEFDWKIEI